MKRLFENYMFFSRWLLAPFLVMLTLGLISLMINAGMTTWHMMHTVLLGKKEEVVLELLDLIDETLTGALVVIVAISVYENFVSTVQDKEATGWPDWMGSIDFSQLKLKLLTTVVAISAIKLLGAFMDVSELADRDLYFYIAIHLTFVVSSLAYAVSDWLSGHRPKH